MKKHTYNPGDVVGKLTLIKRTGARIGSCPEWETRCECGNTHMVSSMSLTNNKGKRGCRECFAAFMKVWSRDHQAETREKIATAWANGKTMQEIADEHGVSKQRIHQIIAKSACDEDVASSLASLPSETLCGLVLKMPKRHLRKMYFLSLSEDVKQ